jgi:hypothetical protein
VIDWYVVLVPLALIPISLLLVFVGCGLPDHGEAHGGGRTIFVHYVDLPKKSNAITAISATFGVVKGSVTLLWPETQWVTIDWGDATTINGYLPVEKFDADGAVDCTVFVTIEFTGTPAVTVAPETAVATKDASVEFELSYQPWAPPAGEPVPTTYQTDGFKLSHVKP